MIIVDATNLLVGRFATIVAKAALLGQEVHVVNAEKAVISGDSATIYARYKQRRERGAPLVGPYFPKQSHMVVKRVIRGMIPYKTARGREAFSRVKCHTGVPNVLAGKETTTYEKANVSKLPELKYTSVAEVARRLGGKQ